MLKRLSQINHFNRFIFRSFSCTEQKCKNDETLKVHNENDVEVNIFYYKISHDISQTNNVITIFNFSQHDLGWGNPDWCAMGFCGW